MDGKFTCKDDIQKISRKNCVDYSIPGHGNNSVTFNSRSKSNKKEDWHVLLHENKCFTFNLHELYQAHFAGEKTETQRN